MILDTMVMEVEVTQVVEGEVMAVVVMVVGTGFLGGDLTVSNVDDLDTGLVNAHQLMVVVAVGDVFLLALSLVVVVAVVVEETGLTEIDLVTDILMTAMMAGAVEAATMTEIVRTAGMVGMVLVAMIDMLATGTCPVVTAFQMIVMGDLIDTL